MHRKRLVEAQRVVWVLKWWKADVIRSIYVTR